MVYLDGAESWEGDPEPVNGMLITSHHRDEDVEDRIMAPRDARLPILRT